MYNYSCNIHNIICRGCGLRTACLWTAGCPLVWVITLLITATKAITESDMSTSTSSVSSTAVSLKSMKENITQNNVCTNILPLSLTHTLIKAKYKPQVEVELKQCKVFFLLFFLGCYMFCLCWWDFHYIQQQVLVCFLFLHIKFCNSRVSVTSKKQGACILSTCTKQKINRREKKYILLILCYHSLRTSRMFVKTFFSIKTTSLKKELAHGHHYTAK